MTENEMEKGLFLPPLPEEKEDDLGVIDSPESIVRDLLKTEKDIALESLRLMRSKNEKERLEWERLYGGKEREISELKNKLDDNENRINSLKSQLNEERQNLVEQLRQKAQEFEKNRLSDRKRWDLIGEEVKGFRETSEASRSKLLAEQERVTELKREAQKKERALQEQINAKEENIAGLNQQLLEKEEKLLKYKSEKDEEIRVLQENLSALKGTFDSEKQEKTKLIEKQDTDLDSLKKALQDMIIQINIERKKKEDALEASQKQMARIAEVEGELKATVRKYESDRTEISDAYKEEQASWEKYKKEFMSREEALRRETEEQITRILRSVEIIEQQLAEEQRLKRNAEDKLKVKDEEIKKLMAQKDEVVIEWRKMLTAEQELRLKRQADMLAEFDKVKAAREEDFGILRNEISNLQAALAEENKLYTLEREQNKQLLQKVSYFEENRQNLIAQLESKEKTWKEAVSSEQELFKKQIEEAVNFSSAQIKARDGEITRLDEDINMFNGQILELRQKLSLEKNENNNRLDRISEFEAQIRNLTAKYNEERGQWNQKFQFIQQQWEEQRQSLLDYQKNLEAQYTKDIKVYEERVKALNEKIQVKSADNGAENNTDFKNQPTGENRNGGKYYPRK